MNLEWKTYASNPLFWYLVRGSKIVGVVRSAYSLVVYEVYEVYLESQTPFAQRTFVASMPTLDEAKHLLQTLIGVRP